MDSRPCNTEEWVAMRERAIADERQMLQDAIGNIDLISSTIIIDCSENLLDIGKLPDMMKAIQTRIRLIQKLTDKAK